LRNEVSERLLVAEIKFRNGFGLPPCLGLEGIVSKRIGSRYWSGRSKDWLKFKNPAAPAAKRKAEEEWGDKHGPVGAGAISHFLAGSFCLGCGGCSFLGTPALTRRPRKNGAARMAMTGENRIMIYGPNDGYVVNFQDGRRRWPYLSQERRRPCPAFPGTNVLPGRILKPLNSPLLSSVQTCRRFISRAVAIHAFVAHSFTGGDEILVGKFLKYFDQLSKSGMIFFVCTCRSSRAKSSR
jgi:hypothetical protein